MEVRLGLISTALLVGASGTAFAQSSVTLYGVADVGIEYLSHAPGPNGSASVVRMSSGNLSTSRWGIRGVEDLGGGLKSVFQLESGIALDSGLNNGGSRLFDRSAYVGLASDQYGTLKLGRQTTPMYDLSEQIDPMAISVRYSLYNSDPIIAGRADNAVKYNISFGNLSAAAFYSFGRTGAGEVPGDFHMDRNVGSSLYYQNEVFSAGVVYDEFQGSTIATQDKKDRRVLLGGTYVIGPMKTFAGYRWLNGSANGNVRSNLYYAGLRYAATPVLSLTGAAYYTDTRDSDADPLMLVASADYAFSKSTDAYLTLGYVRNKGGSQLGLNGFNPTSASPTSVWPGSNQSGAVLGIRHKF